MKAIRITIAALALTALAACSEDTGTPAAADISTSLSGTPSPATPSESESPSETESPSESESGGASAEVGTAKVQGVGTVLVSDDGRTLYLFTNDTGTKSTCIGDCAKTWPAFTTEGKPSTTGGADDGKVGTTKSASGLQVTYDGHPLYLFSGDKAEGEASGQGIGDVWFAVTPDGKPAGQHG